MKIDLSSLGLTNAKQTAMLKDIKAGDEGAPLVVLHGSLVEKNGEAVLVADGAWQAPAPASDPPIVDIYQLKKTGHADDVKRTRVNLNTDPKTLKTLDWSGCPGTAAQVNALKDALESGGILVQGHDNYDGSFAIDEAFLSE